MILLLKVTLILVAGALVAALLTRKSAAARHLVWALTLAGVLAVPLMTPVGQVFPIRVAAWPPSSMAGLMVEGESAAFGQGVPASAPSIPAVVSGEGSAASGVSPRGVSPLPRWRLSLVLGAIWLAGAVMVAAWYLLGHVRLRRLARRATPITSDEWQAVLHESASRLGLSGPVRLLRSGAVGSPLTWGTWRPIVLLPLDAESWPVGRRRVVLAHELAHAVRGDYLTQLVACAASAVYWFHPLVWVAARRLRVESERACDDQVLTHGVSGVDYAAHLLDVARCSRTMRLGGGVAIGMARPSHLEGRLLAVLDPERARHSPPPRARKAAWTGLAAFVFPLALLVPAERDMGPVLLTADRPVTLTADHQIGPADPVVFRFSRDSSFERSVKASPGEQLELDLETGAGVDIRGWDEPSVQVRGRLGGVDWQDTEVTLERTDGGVRLHTWQSRRRRTSSTSHQFEIRVPRRYDVHIKSAGGQLTLADVQGTFDGETGGGGLVIERTRGSARLSTGGGDIRVTQSDLTGVVSTGGGTVVLSAVQGGLKGTSGSGPVVYAGQGSVDNAELEGVRVTSDRIRVVDDRKLAGTGGTLHVTKAGGPITIEAAPMGAEVSTGGGDIRVGASRDFVSASTGGGNVTVGPVAGSVKATTGAGTVQVWISDAKGAERLVDVSAGVGDVIIELPPELSARFDLETGYTASFRRKTRIESDWALPQSETDYWDDARGQTPRKYVRARGQVGTGGPLILVRTTNGNITVRRRSP